MKKAVPLFGLIVLLVLILSPLASVASAEPIIIDTEKGVSGFRSEPARDLPANWQYVHDHPDTSADGWFDTNAYPPGQGNGSFWYTISFPDMGECKGIWETSVPYTGKYEVFAWIPSPDSFDPYLDEATPPSDYLPTKRAQYKVFHNDGVATVSIDQNLNMGGFASLGVFVFDSTARVELSSNGVEFWRSVAFDAVKFVPVVHDMAVTDVSIMPPLTSVGQSTAICVTVTNEGSQQEANVSVKALVDGTQVGLTKYVSLDPGASDTTTILWIPHAAKKYSIEGEVGIVSGETDTGDNTKAIVVGVPATPKPATMPTLPPSPPPSSSTHTGRATSPEEAWNKTFGGIGSDGGFSIAQTPDGGYIVAGVTTSYGAGGYDFWLIKMDSNVNEEWNRTFGGAESDYLYSLAQTSDRGYILTGGTASFGVGERVWLIKTDADGKEEWNKTFYESSGWSAQWDREYGASVQQTEDGGYIIAGEKSLYGHDGDLWLIKTDSDGNMEWDKTLGGSNYDEGRSVQQTPDGGYIITGRSYSYAISGVWLIKTDSIGNEEWSRTFGDGVGESVMMRPDGGYIIAGYTYNNHSVVWLIKTDSNGNEEWNRTFGEVSGWEYYGESVQQTEDVGYIIVGWTRYDTDGGIDEDIYLIKTDSSGNKEWDKSFGGSDQDYGYSVLQTSDRGYLIAGSTLSYGCGSSDVWLIKIGGDSIPNNPPIANAGKPYSGNVNEDIQFKGSGTDPDGDAIIAYAWDFNNDGITDSTLQNPTYSWSSAGTYYPTLKVQDERGAWCKEPNECKVYVVEPFTFVQITDVHIGCEKYYLIPTLIPDPRCKKPTEMSMGWFTSVINRINELAPEVDFVLVTGDLVEYGEPDFFYKFIDVLTRLDSSIRFYHIPGNHDRYTIYGSGDDLTNYHDCVLINGPRQSLIEPDNYTFEYGGYTFIGLDSGADCHFPYYWGTGLTEPQINGVRAFTNLEAPKVIFMHHPVFNDYSVKYGVRFPNWGIIANNRKPFKTYCQDNNVQLVLTGHTHEAKTFNADGKRVGWDSNDRPLFIQTGSVTEHSEYRVIEVNGYDDISVWPSSDQPICFKKSIWSDGSDKSVLHVYDSQGRHTGIDGSGNIVNEIPHSFYIGNYGPMNLEGIILYDDTEDYKLTVTLKDGSIEPLDGKLRQPENQSFNLTITNQTGDSLTTISYDNITFTENTTATINLNRTAVNYTMAIDYTGDNITDETKDPDSIETDYAPTATINTPVNNSIYRYGDKIVFNGTGIDIEDGILTNSSLVWTSKRDGFIGIGCECNTTNLTAGTHIIELTVNDSSGQTDADNVTIAVIAPDLAVTNITFSNPQPIEGEAVTINATVHNNGTANAADVIVQFFDGTLTNGTQIGTNQTIAALNIGENKTVSVVWATTDEAGDNGIWVIADPADTIKEPDEENNQASKNIFVGAPTVLHITQAQTDRAAYLGNEAVLISCTVQNASGNISANVSAEIAKPDAGIDNITLAEGIVGYYYGTFTNTSLSGRYNVTIYANRTGFVGDTESLCFEVLDTTPPASVTNITNTSGPTWINWTWDNPLDPDFDHTLIYLNGSWKTATAGNCYFADGLFATSVYEIATRTVDADGNINATWVNQTAATISPCFIATAAYGTPLHEDIDVLRDFRDEYLMPNSAGRTFVKIYYNTSPPLADVIRDNEGLRTAVRGGLVKPLVHITRRFVG